MTDHHGHSHSPAPPHSSRLSWLTALSAVYLVAEVVGGLLSGSLALLADAGHMAVDVMAMALGLFAMWISQRPPTPEKTYGYLRAEILAALVNGAFLVAVAVGIVVEAVQRLNSPMAIRGDLMGAVAAGGLLINLIALAALHGGRNHSLNVKGIWLHVIADALGSVGALVAAFLVYKFGWVVADPVVSIIVSLFIFWGSWSLLSESVNVLLEGVPRGVVVAQVRSAILSVNGVTGVHDLHVWCMSAGVNSLSAHVRVKEGADHAKALEQILVVLKKQHIEHVTIQIEPPTFLHQEATHVHL